MKGLYIHIPFCLKKCKYCDFTSFVGMEAFFESYVQELTKEMRQYKGDKIDSIFIGGGTPSILNAGQLKIITDYIYNNFDVAADAEFTLESNPGTLTDEKLRMFREAGINRLSIGVQSFNDLELIKIGRIHTAKEAAEAILAARKNGFSNINIDLMFSLPGQTRESLIKTLETALSLNPEHISCYSLILEEDTPLYDEVKKGVLYLPEEEEDRELYTLACEILSNHGYQQYEISNFSKKGYECRHNLKYWDCEEYIGVGIAAHSYYKEERYFNTDSFEKYMKGEYTEEKTGKLSEEDKIKEFIIMGLRKTEGISREEFFKRFKKDFSKLYETEINKFKKLKLLEEKDGFIRLTFEGINLSNSVLCEFV